MSTTTTEPLKLPVLLSLADVAYLVEGQVEPQTVYRWNINSGGRARVMPDPDWTFGVKRPTPMWREDVVLEVLKARGYKVDRKRVAAVRRAQGHPSR